MKFYNRVILTFAAIMLLLLGGLVFAIFFFYSDDYHQYLNNIQEAEFNSFRNIYELKNDVHVKLVKDYAYWTDMAKFTTTKDSNWIATNITLNSPSFDFNIATIYNNEGESIYQIQNQTVLQNFKFDARQIQTMFSRKQSPHFFYRHAGLLVEFFGSPIYNSEDQNQVKQSYGYLIFGKVWDLKYLREIDQSAKVHSSIIYNNTPTRAIKPELGLVISSFELPDFNQRTIGILQIKSHSQLLQIFYISNKTRIISLSVFALLLTIILWLILYQIKKHILLPINRIITAAKSENYHNLRVELTDAPEFLPVAERIILSLQQKQHLLTINEELVELKESLEEKVMSRTQELQQSNTELRKTLVELHQSQDLITAQEKLVSLGTMIAGIAHEINNPAQAIKFSVESLRMNITDIKQLISEIMTLSQDSHSQEMVKLRQVIQYLDFASMVPELDNFVADNLKAVIQIQNIVDSTKRMVYNSNSLIDCDINQVIQDATTLLAGQIKNLITIKLDLQPDLPQYHGLPQELGQVFINLITNAKDAIVENNHSKSSGLLEIKTRYIQERNNIKITVQDNGCGMPQTIIDKIFDPFFTTKAPGKGTGLGLNIVFKILKHHKGSINVESATGRGTLFTIYLPYL